MMRAALSLLLVACTAAPGEAQPTPEPAPAVEAPRRVADRTAPPAPPRLLHPNVRDHAARAAGDLVVVVDDQQGADLGLQVLDPETGRTTPWPQPWRAEEAGWRLRPYGEQVSRVVASPDGAWIAVTIDFITRADDRFQAVVVARADGGEPRCVGVDVFAFEPVFTRGGLLVGAWAYACAPDRRGREVEVTGDGGTRHQLRWYDPHERRGGAYATSIYTLGTKDPLGDMVVEQGSEGQVIFVDLASGAAVGAATLPGSYERLLGWVRADAVYVAHGGGEGRPLARAAVFADGRVVPHTGAAFTILTRLPSGEVLFHADGGPIEQGRVDWETFTVVSSFPRHDLSKYLYPPIRAVLSEHTYRTWTPALGGVLIADKPRGRLALAGL